jgi:transcriptional/translational regulatory protein YebC/TACO1
VVVQDPDAVKKILSLVEKLEDLEDVKSVWHTMELPDGVV